MIVQNINLYQLTLIIMQPIFLFFLLTALSSATDTHHQNSEIHHVAFLKDKLFFITKSQREFGVLSISDREVLSNYRLDQEQTIISVNTTQKKVILRKDRSKVHLFKLDQLDIEQIAIEIAFSHQQIIDFMQSDQHVYILTEKDLRQYDRSDEEKLQLPKHIIASARKRQLFRKIFNQSREYLTLVLTRDQQLCLRKLYLNKTMQQNCLFNLTSQLIQIDRLGSNILVQTRHLNYVITGNQTSYSFRAEASQMDNRYVVVGSLFKTLDLERKIFVQGVAVMGSDAQNQFWIKQKEGKLELFHNGFPILLLGRETVTRTWISREDSGIYYFLLQYGRNNLILYELRQDNNWSAQIMWTFEEYEQPLVEQL